jgi:hypothetical protein
MTKSDWVSLKTILPALLAGFTELRELEVNAIKWIDLMPKTRESFRAMFALPTLVHVRMFNMELPKIGPVLNLIHPRLKQLAIESSFKFSYGDVGGESGKRVQERQLCRLELFAVESC